MNLKPHLNPKYLPMAQGAMRYVRAVAYRFALHETGALLCACAPWVYRAGEALQHWSDPAPAARMADPSPYGQPPAYEEPSSFDF